MRTTSFRRLIGLIAVAAVTLPAALLPVASSASAAGSATGTATGSAAAGPSFTKIEGAAADAAGLQGTVNAFRALLGDDNGSKPGSQPAGRREINWDGTPDAQSAPNALPRDFFNSTVPRGAVFSSAAGSRFQVSADSDNPTNTAVRFGDLNAQYPSIFGTFSPQRLFTPVGTNRMSIRFFQPGSTKPAVVKGFGAVFTDVDKANTTKIELYDRWGARLWWNAAPKAPTASKGLSFLGVTTSADVYEVRITTGNAPLSRYNTDTSSRDVVVMDDFVFAEPKPLS
jgi:hypothetical protein